MALPAFGGLKANILAGAGEPALNWNGAAFGVESRLPALPAVAEFAEKLNADVCGATSVKLNAGFGSALLLPPAVAAAAFEPKLNTPLAGVVAGAKLNATLGAVAPVAAPVIFDVAAGGLLLELNMFVSGEVMLLPPLFAAAVLAPNGLFRLPKTVDIGPFPLLLPALGCAAAAVAVPVVVGAAAAAADMPNGELTASGCIAFVVFVPNK